MPLTQYANRIDAGQQLLAAVQELHLEQPRIIAIPRGGVVVAAPLALHYQTPIKLVMAHKVGTPQNKELAVGAVTPDGRVLYHHRLMTMLGLSKRDLKTSVQNQWQEIGRRMEEYGAAAAAHDVRGQDILLVDDGIATGFTVKAALQYLRRLEPKRLVLAVPVAPPDALVELAQETDAIACPLTPQDFYAVGAYYLEFPPVDDYQVREILELSKTWSNF